MSPERVMLGTDAPFPLGDPAPGQLIREHPGFDADTTAKLLAGNARDFFAMEGP